MFISNIDTTDLSDSSTDKMARLQERKTETSRFIPNIDTIRYTFLTSLLLLNKHSVLIIGKIILKYNKTEYILFVESQSTKSITNIVKFAYILF